MLSENSLSAQFEPELAINVVGEQLKRLWKNTVTEIVSIGDYLESIRQELMSQYGNKGERFFQKALSQQPHFPVTFAKLCHKVSLWYASLSESHRKFLHRFGWGLSPSCLKELIKFSGDLLVEFFSQKQQRQEIKIKDIRDFLTQKTKIWLELPVTSEHLEIIQRHYNLDSETKQSIKTELEELNNATTTNLLEILKKRKFKVQGIFKKPSPSKSQPDKETPQVEKNLTEGKQKLYTEAELQNAIHETVEIAKSEFSQIAKQQSEESQKKIQEITEEFNKIKTNYQKLKAENLRLKEVLAQREGKKNQGVKNSYQNTNFPNFTQINNQTKSKPNKPKGFGNSYPR